MAMKPTITDREYDKFEEVDGLTTVRVTGSNFSGTFTSSGLRVRGFVTEVAVNNLTWTALPVTALVGRNAIRIQNRSGQEIKTNYDNTDIGSPLPAGYVGMVVPDFGETYYDITDEIVIYAKSISGACTVTIEELA